MSAIPAPELVALFHAELEIAEPSLVFRDGGVQAPVAVTGGRFEGERISGTVLGGGNDWLVIDGEGIYHVDVLSVLQIDGGPAVLCSYHGRIVMPDDGLERIAGGETLPPGDLYFRVAPTFVTDPGEYGWLNSIQAIGVGTMGPGSVIYDVFEVR